MWHLTERERERAQSMLLSFKCDSFHTFQQRWPVSAICNAARHGSFAFFMFIFIFLVVLMHNNMGSGRLGERGCTSSSSSSKVWGFNLSALSAVILFFYSLLFRCCCCISFSCPFFFFASCMAAELMNTLIIIITIIWICLD